MMGLKERAFAPLVSVSLEELVPQDHFYRHLQRVLDVSFVHELVRERYAVAGRPSIDPVVFYRKPSGKAPVIHPGDEPPLL